jgi:hypothetical protein
MWIKKSTYEKINDRLESLERKVWGLENPPKYKATDKVYYQGNPFTVVGDCFLGEDFIYGKLLDLHFKIPKRYVNKYNIVSEDFSLNVRTVNEYELSFEHQPEPKS